MSIVAGIGFTVAIFIAGLAFAAEPSLLAQAKLGIIAGSLASGLAGVLLIALTARVREPPAADEAACAESEHGPLSG